VAPEVCLPSLGIFISKRHTKVMILIKKTKKMKTPITYWGGKQQMVEIILPLIPPHKQYDEPFFGGGAIYFAKKPSEI